MSDPDLPEADRAPGAPHPRETVQLLGQAPAAQDFLDAWNGERLHHGWLLTGPQGVGKATLAWQIARFLLATPPRDDGGLFGAPEPETSLHISEDHPVARRMVAGSEPGLFVLRRPYDQKSKRLKTQITVDEVRKLKGFFSLSATDGGQRVVIVDSADEMNVSAANALLKVLEEPPARTTLLLISHQPSRLLPTIRSRCRTLRLAPLASDDLGAALAAADLAVAPSHTVALSELAAGSVGQALRLVTLDGLQLYADLVALVGTAPNLDRARAGALADSVAGRGKEDRLDLMLTLLETLLARLARTGALGQAPAQQAAPNESTVLSRLSPTPKAGQDWARLAQETTDRLRHARAVNVDPSTAMLDALLRLNAVA